MKSVIKGPKTGFQNFSLKQTDLWDMNINITGSKISNIIQIQPKYAKNIFKRNSQHFPEFPEILIKLPFGGWSSEEC